MNTDQDAYSCCRLCPRKCEVDRTKGNLGVCKSTSEIDIARASLHMWEEPPISGTAGSGAIFFTGCSLGCVYCQNYHISRSTSGNILSVFDLADLMLRLQQDGALNINLVTPTHYAPSIRSSISIAKDKGLMIPIIWNTSGYELAKCVMQNESYVDIYLTDFKYGLTSVAKKYSRVDDYIETALDALEAMVKCTLPTAYDTYNGDKRLLSGVLVRHMVIPGEIDNSKRALKMLFERFGNTIQYSIMNQYTPTLKTLADNNIGFAVKYSDIMPNLFRSVSSEEYESVLDFADQLGIDNYFWQDGETCEESFIPEFLNSNDPSNYIH